VRLESNTPRVPTMKRKGPEPIPRSGPFRRCGASESQRLHAGYGLAAATGFGSQKFGSRVTISSEG
jgi:hypothetical protein